MACVVRKTGASGKQSPYWQAKLKGAEGKQVWQTTKVRNRKSAAMIAQCWEDACRLAECNQLTPIRAQTLCAGVAAMSETTKTLEITRKLVARLLEVQYSRERKHLNEESVFKVTVTVTNGRRLSHE